jgi:hypothetical protein
MSKNSISLLKEYSTQAMVSDLVATYLLPLTHQAYTTMAGMLCRLSDPDYSHYSKQSYTVSGTLLYICLISTLGGLQYLLVPPWILSPAVDQDDGRAGAHLGDIVHIWKPMDEGKRVTQQLVVR